MAAPTCANPECDDPVDKYRPLEPLGVPRKYCRQQCGTDAFLVAHRDTHGKPYIAPSRESKKRPIPGRPCDHCGQNYAPKSAIGRYCTGGCRREAAKAGYRIGHPERQPQPCGNPACDQLVQPPKRGKTARYCKDCSDPRKGAASRSREPMDYSSIAGIRKECELIQRPDVPIELGPCWIWQRSRGKDGYARYSRPKWQPGSKHGTVHKLVATLTYGDIGNLQVGHICNRGGSEGCVNPDHIKPVTQLENCIEMHQRNWLLRHISELRSALAATTPRHPLLRVDLPEV